MKLYAIYTTDQWKTKNRPVAAVCTSENSAVDVIETFILDGSMDYTYCTNGDHEDQAECFRSDVGEHGFEYAISNLEFGYVDIVDSDEVL